eukprot:CAMPEP_0202006836 /NCGR_PEP_ID=MMETSP0905-20130828/11468_1 /ASSEMBLY_ACC=CAM_ASM_000554 /TAXON_ID=420261 /ORGANISM="Thalassiosira antarctica, Strain CCMP982" /LENGTH=87 /DNA_ID=CAMNT_0048564673 /DNA_START=204 /DNA_END=464 /DNA_ORIENTATION=-
MDCADVGEAECEESEQGERYEIHLLYGVVRVRSFGNNSKNYRNAQDASGRPLKQKMRRYWKRGRFNRPCCAEVQVTARGSIFEERIR